MPSRNRLRIEIYDHLRHSRSVRHGLALLRYVQDFAFGASGPDDVAKEIAVLCTAARWAHGGPLMRMIERRIEKLLPQVDIPGTDWEAYFPRFPSRYLEKAVMLKPRISDREKGVLFISFEYQWARLFHVSNLAELAQRYTLVISPSWSPPHHPGTVVFPSIYPDSIFTLISNQQDLDILPRLSEKYIPVPLYASSWVDPDGYEAVPVAEKDIDVFMLANFGTYKRHFALFKALQQMPESLRVLLIGQPNDGRTAETLMREAGLYGVGDRFRLMENASDEDLNRALAHSKVSIILSKQEGSCVAVTESMLAGTPVGILEDAIIGSKAFLNPHTGRLLRDRDLGKQLTEFVAQAAQYDPRAWMLDNGITCYGSTKVLNDVLRRRALEEGQEWTTDIAVHYWRPNPRLLHEEDHQRMAADYHDFEKRFGISLGMPAAEG